MGLTAGMTLADARALLPDLTVADADPSADAKALAALTEWCGRYSPWCAPDGEDGIRLDITGCAHLFGGEAAMLADAIHRLWRFGIAARGAVADTPAAAWGWARYRRKSASPILGEGETAPLLPLPVAALRLEPGSIDTLGVLGLNTIATVVDLPRGPLTQRLGAAVLGRLDRMFGRAAEPISPHAIAEPWASRLIFPEPIGRREDIDAAAERLTAHLCRAMSLKGQGARRLILRFYRVDGAVQHIAIGTSRPTQTPTHILRLFAERLDQVEPGFGIEAIVLEATEAEPLGATQGALTAAGDIDATDLAGLIDRLQNRLGAARVVQLVPVESHVPERAEVREKAKAPSPFQPAAGPLPLPLRGRGAHESPSTSGRGRGPRSGRVRGPSILKSARPATLLPIPEPIDAIAPVPDDPPLTFRWRRIQYRVAFADGPERIEPEWWRREDQAKPRDYYRVEGTDGRRFWLYREGLYGMVEPPRWYLHGFFP
ncbi:MAG TPA: DNA polymerase Y family protein [Alphaproteobacteria bacterium]|jgi:protein ImuB|nr:DNA polymerase Y family protein [Alphaproteobacteria bacterium]